MDDARLRYFDLSEFACRHCGANRMANWFLRDLDELRHQFGRPLIITSGYRCPTHNAVVSSTGRAGPHTSGCAADIGVSRGAAYALLRLALALGFTGIGVAQKSADRFIHLDKLPAAPGRPRPSVWSY